MGLRRSAELEPDDILPGLIAINGLMGEKALLLANGDANGIGTPISAALPEDVAVTVVAAAAAVCSVDADADSAMVAKLLLGRRLLPAADRFRPICRGLGAAVTGVNAFLDAPICRSGQLLPTRSSSSSGQSAICSATIRCCACCCCICRITCCICAVAGGILAIWGTYGSMENPVGSLGCWWSRNEDGGVSKTACE